MLINARVFLLDKAISEYSTSVPVLYMRDNSLTLLLVYNYCRVVKEKRAKLWDNTHL